MFPSDTWLSLWLQFLQQKFLENHLCASTIVPVHNMTTVRLTPPPPPIPSFSFPHPCFSGHLVISDTVSISEFPYFLSLSLWSHHFRSFVLNWVVFQLEHLWEFETKSSTQYIDGDTCNVYKLIIYFYSIRCDLRLPRPVLYVCVRRVEYLCWQNFVIISCVFQSQHIPLGWIVVTVEWGSSQLAVYPKEFSGDRHTDWNFFWTLMKQIYETMTDFSKFFVSSRLFSLPYLVLRRINILCLLSWLHLRFFEEIEV